jgi:hypothetical protein
MPEPRPRSPAQIEASRRNGARSKDPTTPEGKAKASRNALKHGLTATHHLVLEDEVPDDLDDLIATITEETGAAGEIEARLARRLAIAFWKGERAERIETALFDAAPKLRPPQHGFEWEEVDPLTTFDLRRFNTIRGQQAPIGRKIGRCLKELRQLRKDALPVGTDEPEPVPENEPKDAPPPANDDKGQVAETEAPAVCAVSRNEPERPSRGADPLTDPWQVPGSRLRAMWGHDRDHRSGLAAGEAEASA